MKNYWHKRINIPKYIVKKINTIISESKEIIETLTLENNNKICLLEVEPSLFSKVFAQNRKYLYHGDYTSPADVNGYANCKCFLTNNGLAGFAVSNDGWLTSLFSNLNCKGFLQSVKKVINQYATKLECFCTVNSSESKLIKLYEDIGFQICAKTRDDRNDMIEYYGNEFVHNFLKYYGIPYHVFMIASNKKIKQIKIFDNYYVAHEYINKMM